jgi:hypothetical protein
VVTFTGGAVGGTGPFEYEFQARFTNGTYGVVRNYMSDNTWTWDTTGAPATGYEILVNVRRAGTAGPDASAAIPYTLTDPVGTVSLGADPAGGTVPGDYTVSMWWTAWPSRSASFRWTSRTRGAPPA